LQKNKLRRKRNQFLPESKLSGNILVFAEFIIRPLKYRI
jgi:hypothetical protein